MQEWDRRPLRKEHRMLRGNFATASCVIRIVVENAMVIFGVLERKDIDLPGERRNKQPDTNKILLNVWQISGTDESARSEVEFMSANSQVNPGAFTPLRS